MITTALSYIFAHFFLIISVIVVSAVLGYLAFVLKNWKIALAALVLVGAGLVYQHADLGGYKRRIAEEKAQEIELLQTRIATLQHLSSIDNQRALSDAKLNTQLETLSRATPVNTGPCLDLGAALRVRAIGNLKPRSAPLSPGRPTSLLPRHSPAPQQGADGR